MKTTVQVLIFLAMVGLTVVSMWTTYVSLHDSVLPAPTVGIPLPNGAVWECSVFALAMSVAIGMMLFALKLAIIDGEKRLGILGTLGLTVVAFISISFNLDVLYRTADRDFFIRFSSARMKQTYADYLAQVQTALNEKRVALRKDLALQEGELEAEVRGLREAPAGYGPIAKQEDYRLTLLAKTIGIDLESLDKAHEAKQQADMLLATRFPTSLDEIEQLQDELRVAVKDTGAVAGVPVPPAVRLEAPLFAVFAKLFDLQTVGFKEVFFLVVAFFLDLGDIIGYSLVPNRKKKERRPAPTPLETSGILPAPLRRPPEEESNLDLADSDAEEPVASNAADGSHPPYRRRKPQRFRMRF